MDNYQLLLEFTNGELGLYDCKPLLNFGVFKELQDIAYFKQVTVLHGTVSWKNEHDICPDTLYLECEMINSSIVAPKFVALDSSILNYLADDYFSLETSRQKDSASFLKCLTDNSFIPFLCLHHFHEMIKIRDDRKAKDRFNFLRLLPQVAWVSSHTGDNQLGSMIDILVAECQTVLQENKISLLDVRNKTRNSLIQFGTGIKAMSSYEEVWENEHPYRPNLWRLEEKTRKNVVIRRSKVNNISKIPLSNFLNGGIREPEELNTLLNQFKTKLSEEIQNRGDKQISNPNEVASRFYDEMADGEEVIHLKNGGLQQFLKYHEIDIEKLGKNAVMEDVLKLIDFRARLKVAHKNKFSNIPWNSFKESIQPEQIPSWVIESSLFLHSQEQPEYKGSELNDYWLACLSPYVDLIYVDKRVKNDFERAFRKDLILRELLNKVKIERVKPYQRLREEIEAHYKHE